MAPNGKEETKAAASSTLVAAAGGSDDKFAPSVWGDFFINYEPSATMQACICNTNNYYLVKFVYFLPRSSIYLLCMGGNLHACRDPRSG
jgi:hypothetical protein